VPSVPARHALILRELIKARSFVLEHPGPGPVTGSNPRSFTSPYATQLEWRRPDAKWRRFPGCGHLWQPRKAPATRSREGEILRVGTEPPTSFPAFEVSHRPGRSEALDQVASVS